MNSFYCIPYKSLPHFMEPLYPPVGRNQGQVDLLQTDFRESVFKLAIQIFSTFKLNRDENQIYWFLNQFDEYRDEGALKYQAVELHNKLASLLVHVFKEKKEGEELSKYLQEELLKILPEFELSDKFHTLLSLSLLIVRLISKSKKLKKMKEIPKDQKLKEIFEIDDDALKFLKDYCLEFFLPILEKQFSLDFTREDFRQTIQMHFKEPYSSKLEILFFKPREEKLLQFLFKNYTIDNYLEHLNTIKWLEMEDIQRLGEIFEEKIKKREEEEEDRLIKMKELEKMQKEEQRKFAEQKHYYPIQIILLLFDGQLLKKRATLKNIPAEWKEFEKAVREKLDIKDSFKMFKMEDDKEVRLKKQSQISKLKDEGLVIVRLEIKDFVTSF